MTQVGCRKGVTMAASVLQLGSTLCVGPNVSMLCVEG